MHSKQRLTFRFQTSWFETFAKFLQASVSVSENLVSEKSLGFGEFGLGKKYQFRIIWSGKKVSVLVFGKFGLGKKSWFQFHSKFWSHHSVIASTNHIGNGGLFWLD